MTHTDNINRLLRLAFHQSPIHVIGDSHVQSFKHFRYITHHLGAVTAYGLGNTNSHTQSYVKVRNIFKEMQSTGDRDIILVFGEIDCRIHIYNHHFCKQRTSGIAEIIQQAIRNYGKTILLAKKMGFNVNVFNVVPPGDEPNVYNYPNYADWPTRLAITREFNAQLNNFCNKHSVRFIEIFSLISNPDGSPMKKYLTKNDHVHLNSEISELLLKKYIF